MHNYTVYHLHSDLSLLDSATKFHKYIERAKELGMKALAFSEHGNVFNWIKKKEEIEKHGMKYIHGIEVYVTESLEKKVRDNYHVILLAKNLEGVKEINRLSSISNNRKDGHFYYNPRITLNELINTSDNILVTSACLGGILGKGNKNVHQKFLNFAIKNKHRVFLEIQYHNVKEQKDLNKELYELSKKYGLQLIVGTDTHAINKDYLEARKILMQAKGMIFTNEEEFDLSFKSYEELIEMFKKQNSLPLEAVLDAIEFTNTMADMVEEFELDKSHKYPKVEGNSEEIYKQQIKEGIEYRGLNKFELIKRKTYYHRIKEEFKTYKQLGAIDYMVFQKDVIDWANDRGIYQGFSRGSVSGSLIAYLLKITEMDSIKHKLNFTRFMNPHRVTLPDIDVDYPPSRRQEVINYVASKPNVYFSEIVTFNTIADKGAIREVGRSLEIPLNEVDEIAKNYEIKAYYYRKKYPKLFKYVDLLRGTNVSVGSHPSGFVVSPIPLDENVGLFYTSESKYPVSQVNMKELDGCNYVKLDMLGLDNIELINDTCKLAGIERLTPDNVDINDEKVWESIHESALGVFQWEGDFAHAYYKKLFSKETIGKIKKQNPNFSFIDLFSIGNGAIRPSGESFRDDLANGVFKDNGHKALNEFLKDTNGYLVYQEQISEFLVKFSGFTMAESDMVRRGLAKKVGTEQYLPAIHDGFIKTMAEKFGENEEHAKKILKSFLEVISSASRYSFSLNHSQSYSFIGYVNAYLRYYYPLEFITVLLNIKKDKIEKTGKIFNYAYAKGIKIKPIKFRKSLADYSLVKEENTIYKGLKSIKFLNTQIAEELFELGKKQYDDFIDLLIDVTENTSVNTRQLKILIVLNFFSEFGKNGKLLKIYEEFEEGEHKYKKTYVTKTKIKRVDKLKEIYGKYSKLEKDIPISEQIMFEREHLGYVQTTFNIKDDYAIVVDIDKKYTPKLILYCFKTGEEKMYKMAKKHFYDKYDNDLLVLGDVIKINKTTQKPRTRFVDGKFEPTGNMDDHLISISKYKIK